MTTQDLILHLTAIQVCETKEIQRIRRQSKIDQQKELDRWAKEHARFNIGDIIHLGLTTIRVEKIEGGIDRNVPYVVYYGHALTKQLKDRADGWVTSIYDDSPERNIIKIK